MATPEDISLSRTDEAPYVRIVQMDVLRGFAVLGIYWINIFVFALPYSDYGIPEELNDNSMINLVIQVISEIFVEGTMRGLFSALFGASALIFLAEARLAASGLELVDRYYRRTLILIMFGVIHGYLLLWPYDVLYAYGLLGLACQRRVDGNLSCRCHHRCRFRFGYSRGVSGRD